MYKAQKQVSLPQSFIMEPGGVFVHPKTLKLSIEFAGDMNGIANCCPEGVFVGYFHC